MCIKAIKKQKISVFLLTFTPFTIIIYIVTLWYKGKYLFMIRINDTVKRETLYITAFVIILSVLMQAVFLVFRTWDYTILLGNLLSGFFAVINFLLMGIGVQISVEKDELEAKKTIKLSHTYRSLMLFLVIILGVALPCFNTLASIIPHFFPRIAIMLRPLFDKRF